MSREVAENKRKAFLKYILDYLNNNVNILEEKKFSSLNVLRESESNFKSFITLPENIKASNSREYINNIAKKMCAAFNGKALPNPTTLNQIRVAFKIPLSFTMFADELEKNNSEYVKYLKEIDPNFLNTEFDNTRQKQTKNQKSAEINFNQENKLKHSEGREKVVKSGLQEELVIKDARIPLKNDTELIYGLKNIGDNDHAIIEFPLQIVNAGNTTISDIEIIYKFSLGAQHSIEDKNIEIETPLINKLFRKRIKNYWSNNICYSITSLHPGSAIKIPEPLIFEKTSRIMEVSANTKDNVKTKMGFKVSLSYPFQIIVLAKDMPSKKYNISLQLVEIESLDKLAEFLNSTYYKKIGNENEEGQKAKELRKKLWLCVFMDTSKVISIRKNPFNDLAIKTIFTSVNSGSILDFSSKYPEEFLNNS